MKSASLFSGRMSHRRFKSIEIKKELIFDLIVDATEAPTACNHQLHHFIIIDQLNLKKKLQEISGSNDHFNTSSHIIIMCFQKGWNHNKFAVVQSTAAVAYNLCLSAHQHGIASVWNAGIGNTEAVRELLSIPVEFEVIGALCLGYADQTLSHSKPPRKPVNIVTSFNKFVKSSDYIYPLRKSTVYKFEDIKNHRSRVAQHSPKSWTLAQIMTWRAYAVFAKSPIPGVYISRRLGSEMDKEIYYITNDNKFKNVLEVMPYGGSYTVLLRKKLNKKTVLHVCDMHKNNISFTLERVKNELGSSSGIKASVMDNIKLPYEDVSMDAIILPQIVEGLPSYDFLIEECHRVLKPGGVLVVSVKNKLSWFEIAYRLTIGRGQVTNFGPYKPINILRVRRLLSKKFKMINECGVSPSHFHIAKVTKSRLRFFCRLWVAKFVKR